ncbi:hypothetical protein AMATHDRAFT_40434 [Amanita thiersii Skay4041]|uniref:Uncharacterized protein n=1 Tax=Amanita thiersii Skay4041 TaxID=703135 RepID=A0A2A9NLP4_9AGAR|nr:hypothetical protein AMATHDRAFT_40434 [Amanita thiersii Skay4041]
MPKPVITYMRKKNASRLQEHEVNADKDSPATIMNPIKRSRARSIALQCANISKKPRTLNNVLEEIAFQTPCPSTLSESQVFKLQCSKGLTLSPDHQFSPVPVALNSSRFPSSVVDTTSRKLASTHSRSRLLKENMKHKTMTFPSVLRSRTSSRSRPHHKLKATLTKQGLSSPPHLQDNQKSYMNQDFGPALNPTSALASPFSSRPPSTSSSPKGSANTGTLLCSGCERTSLNPKSRMRRGLDITCNSLQIHSTTTSPIRLSPLDASVRGESYTHVTSRRPSVPTSSRPYFGFWPRSLPQKPNTSSDDFPRANVPGTSPFAATMHKEATELSLYDLDSSHISREKWTWSDAPVNFNRPPSQLSFNSDFFNDVQGVSTPLRGDRIRGDHSDLIAWDTNADVGSCKINSVAASPRVYSRNVSNTINSCFSSRSWTTDSIISTPSEYGRPGKDGPACRDESPSLDSDDDWSGSDDSNGNENSSTISSNFTIEGQNPFTPSKPDACDITHREAVAQTAWLEALNSAFCHLDLSVAIAETKNNVSQYNNISPSRTDEINQETTTNSSVKQLSCSKVQKAGRNRRGTIRASEIYHPKQVQPLARRNRSGTIVGSSAIGRTRSGTVTRPISPLGSVVSTSNETYSEVDPSASPSIKNQHTGEVDNAKSALLLDLHDELDILGDKWQGEDWEPWNVAEPVSPVVHRKPGKSSRLLRTVRSLPLQKRMSLEVTSNSISENILEKDGSDDELLLKPGSTGIPNSNITDTFLND